MNLNPVSLALLWGAVLSILVARVSEAKLVCSNTTATATTQVSQADFLFLIDASGSMCDNIKGVKSGLLEFSKLIQTRKMDARFSLVRFGGDPQIWLPFTVSYFRRFSSFAHSTCSSFTSSCCVAPDTWSSPDPWSIARTTSNC